MGMELLAEIHVAGQLHHVEDDVRSRHVSQVELALDFSLVECGHRPTAIGAELFVELG